MSRRRDQRMRAEAIRRVLARTHDRLAIASVGDLRRAYEDELTAYGAEIGAEMDRIPSSGSRSTTPSRKRSRRRCHARFAAVRSPTPDD
jgi:hypothetical protein